MKYFQLCEQYDNKGRAVYRSLGVLPEDRSRLTEWLLVHQKGRDVARESFGCVRFSWRSPRSKEEADFPVSSTPYGLWSERAVQALQSFLNKNGDLHLVEIEGAASRYYLFDCWSAFEAVPNDDFSHFEPRSLKTVLISSLTELPDVFAVKMIGSVCVSEAFKAAAEGAGLTGMDFQEIEVTFAGSDESRQKA